MVSCDDCGTDAREVWRLCERNESMTHRTVRWLCRDCNPDVDRPIGDITVAGPGATDEKHSKLSD